MRKAAFCLLMLFGSLAAVGQSTPQWKVVSAGNFSGTGSIPYTTLFTAKGNGLYRISAYFSATSTVSQNAGWAAGFNWTDQTGTGLSVGLDAYLYIGTSYSTVNPYVFTMKAGTPIMFTVQESNSPQEATYELEFSVEQLVK